MSEIDVSKCPNHTTNIGGGNNLCRKSNTILRCRPQDCCYPEMSKQLQALKQENEELKSEKKKFQELTKSKLLNFCAYYSRFKKKLGLVRDDVLFEAEEKFEDLQNKIKIYEEALKEIEQLPCCYDKETGKEAHALIAKQVLEKGGAM